MRLITDIKVSISLCGRAPYNYGTLSQNNHRQVCNSTTNMLQTTCFQTCLGFQTHWMMHPSADRSAVSDILSHHKPVISYQYID